MPESFRQYSDDSFDYVVAFDASDAAAIVRAIRPDVSIFRHEKNHFVAIANIEEFVRSYGGRVMVESLLESVADRSVHENGNCQRRPLEHSGILK